MVDHVRNKGISAHGHLFWAVLMGIFILGSAHLEYLGWLLLFCKCGFVMWSVTNPTDYLASLT